MKVVFHAGIITCIYLHDVWLAAGYMIYILSLLYDHYKALKAKEALKAELKAMGYQEESEGVFKQAVEALDRLSNGSKGSGGGNVH